MTACARTCGPPKQPLASLINRSVNQTLSRTILTSGTTFVATLALYLLGGGVIHDFALTMLIGVFVGTACVFGRPAGPGRHGVLCAPAGAPRV